MNDRVLSNVIGQSDTQSVSASLIDYRRYQILDRDYPGIFPSKGDKVTGKLIFNLSDKHIQRLDDFEGDEYKRESVTVSTETGTFQAYTFVWLQEGQLLRDEKDWSFDKFIQQDLEKWVTGHRQF